MTSSPNVTKKHGFTLSAVVDVQSAGMLLNAARERQSQPKPLLIDAGAVERITTPGLQILLSLLRSRRANGLQTTITSASDAFRNAIAALGLTPHFKEFLNHG